MSKKPLELRWSIELVRPESPELEGAVLTSFGDIATMADFSYAVPHPLWEQAAILVGQQIADTILVRIAGYNENKTRSTVSVTVDP